MSHRLYKTLEPVVSDLGYELWHLESVGSGKNATLRLFIDSPNGIGIDDCETVSHEVSVALDVMDDGSSSYQLEVSSPGLDRPLVTAEHFERFTGHWARVNMFAPVAGQRRFKGKIRAVNEQAVELACEDADYELPLGDIAKARLEPIFADME